ncbi:DUF2330 domain-containing protein [Trichocoleus desertorum GB2-A4]|uniref:DUF2330 domain-containing protein n=2 Tax=Trichocoleusaceae TaxID=2303527 RepID=A0ABV0JBE2_9CYAN|nr:DUF2330 domain-containing protein [Trichocoleus sp. FACHB-46]MBD1860894.1 DUF2330 domain-containing protein [Trichocoleus sp. FACHB-46]
MKPLRILLGLLLALVILIGYVPNAWAFCGFYVAKADTKLYNKASQVAIARDGERTVLTMANDFQGDVKDFAIVVPVPVVLKQEQVHVGDPKVLERLDAFSAPRLVEYFDSNPCETQTFNGRVMAPSAAMAGAPTEAASDNALGVKVEAQFTVGEYDIVILSAKESSGLETWLNRSGYRIPRGAKQLLQPYIRQNLKFFVAKVNLAEFEKAGYQFLRPIQMAYESPKFMLPIRLGMINAATEQDLIVYLLSPQGQAEVTNYRTVQVPSDAEIPVFVKNEFGDFYKSMFQTAYTREGKKVAFLEYAWDMGNCDPCSAEPLNPEELRQAGVFWLNDNTSSNVFLTRIHVRYTRDKFPEDLMFQETSNRQSFQGRYVLRHAFTAETNCAAGRQYKRALPARFEQEAQTLAKLTGWNIQDIRQKLPAISSQTAPWWRNLWPK